MESTPQGSDRLKEVALLLKQADKLVKEGDLASALELIVKARSFDSRHLYALAYEERVRSLLNAKQAEQPKKETPSQAHTEPPKPAETKPPTASPALQHLSNLAIIEAQHSATVAAQKEKAVELHKKEEEERTRNDELRRNAIEQKIQAFLNRANAYFSKQEYNRALDEIARAYLLDPVNETIHKLEDEIRRVQETARVREEEERQKKIVEEKLRREELLKANAHIVHKEKEEKLKREEHDRKKAQLQKVQQYLQRVNELFQQNKLDEALSELAFVVVIDPLNEEVLHLEQKIIETQERRQQEQLELYQKQLEERQKKRQTILATIQKHIENAEVLAKQLKFSDALRTITRATVLDPVNEDLQKCEHRILAAQEEYLKQEEEKRRQIQEQIRKQQEEELLRVERANRERVLTFEKQEQDEKVKANKDKIAKYLERAKGFLADHQFEVALGEVALAFIVNPFDEDVKTMEQQIIRAREEYSKKNLEQIYVSEEDEKEKIVTQIADHMKQAGAYRKEKDYSRAFNEVARAFILDPLNEDIQRYENELQEEFDQYLADQHALREQEEHERQIRIHIERATEYLERELFEESLTEIATGLTIDEQNADLLSLQELVQASYRKWQVKTLDEARNYEVQRHYLRAKELFTVEKYNEAIDELQRALSLDPYRDECLQLKNEIEEVQHSSVSHSAESKKDQIFIHINNAEKLLQANLLDRAFVEIVSGLVIDPSNAKLLQLESEAHALRAERAKTEKQSILQQTTSQEEKDRMVRVHTHVAEEYRRQKEYSKALDELTQAYVIDPGSAEVAEMEKSVREEYEEFIKQRQRSLKLIYRAG